MKMAFLYIGIFVLLQLVNFAGKVLELKCLPVDSELLCTQILPMYTFFMRHSSVPIQPALCHLVL